MEGHHFLVVDWNDDASAVCCFGTLVFGAADLPASAAAKVLERAVCANVCRSSVAVRDGVEQHFALEVHLGHVVVRSALKSVGFAGDFACRGSVFVAGNFFVSKRRRSAFGVR